MATNKGARDLMAVAAVVIVLVVTVAANLLADRKFARLDLTSEKKYSLTEPFKRIVEKLDDTATITYYTSSKAPAWFESPKRDILDKLQEIATASNGKIVLEAVDPTENKELDERLGKAGFKHPVQDISKNQYVAMTLYTGAEITYKAKPKVQIPMLWPPDSVEYILGSKILELTLPKKPVIAVCAPAPTQPPMMMGQRQPPQGGYEWLQQGMWEGAREKFEVKPVDLSENNSVPADAALLILVRPKALNDRQRYEVVKYLAGGGKVFLIASPFKLTFEFNWRGEKTPMGLEDYLKEIGLGFGDGIVADHSNLEMLKWLNPITGESETERYPFYVRILGKNIDSETAITRFMPELLVPTPSEITLDDAQLQKNSLANRVLARTSEQSWTVPFSENFNPDTAGKYDPEKQAYTGSKNVFVMLSGKFPFPYEGKPVPAWKADAEPEKDKDKEKDTQAPENAAIERKEGVLVVCSAPEAFHSAYLGQRGMQRQWQTNAAFIANISEAFSLGDDLVKLRAKRYETRTIETFAGKTFKQNMLKVGLIAGMPAVVAIIALVVMVLRRAAQNRYERKFSQTSGPSSFNP
jgi:ABC-2 type transport system permease protein